MAVQGKADHVIQDVAGCGLFQTVLVILILVVGLWPIMITMTFMAFGIYVPTWTCLDQGKNANELNRINDNDSIINMLSSSNQDVFNATTMKYRQGEVPLFENKSLSKSGNEEDECVMLEACTNVQFDPTISTIATEWGLVCNHAWIGSTIISIQMTGVLVGSLIIGHLGDAIGRKKTLLLGQILLTVSNIISVFSTGWVMFAATFFVAGMSCAGMLSISFAFITEYSNIKWRGILGTLPVYSLIGIVTVLIIMWLKDWRHVQIVNCALGTCSIISFLWVPESLRWLEIKNKTKEFDEVSKRIIKINGKTTMDSAKSQGTSLTTLDNLRNFDEINSGNNMSTTPATSQSSPSEALKNSPKPPHLLHLFKRNYLSRTLVTSLSWFTCSVWYYGLSFGVKSMSGNFFLNAIIFYTIEIPFHAIPLITMNRLGRKVSFYGSTLMTTFAFLAAVTFSLCPHSGQLQTVGVTAAILVARGGVVCCWIVVITQTAEMYPTAVRMIAQGWGSLMARVGGIVSPFLIPVGPDSAYVCYAVMAGLGLLACLASTRLPEMKGAVLTETLAGQGEKGDREEEEGGML